ncbi:MAG: hypothetical protein AAF721_29785 [Myxococcota bacterium]
MESRGCNECRADVAQCNACEKGLHCRATEVDGLLDQPMTMALGTRDGAAAILWAPLPRRSGGVCQALSLAAVNKDLSLAPAFELDRISGTTGVSLVGTAEGWLVAVGEAGRIRILVVDAQSGERSGQVEIPIEGSPTFAAGGGAEPVLLWINAEGNSAPPHAAVLGVDGQLLGGPTQLWSRARGGVFGPRPVTTTPNGFATVAGSIGFNGAASFELVALGRRGDVLERMHVEDAPGKPWAVAYAGSEWTVWSVGDGKIWRTVATPRSAKHTLVGPLLRPRSARRDPAVEAAIAIGDHRFMLAVDRDGVRGPPRLVEVQRTRVAKPLLVNDDPYGAQVELAVHYGKPLLAWAGPRFRRPNPGRPRGKRHGALGTGHGQLIQLAQPR